MVERLDDNIGHPFPADNEYPGNSQEFPGADGPPSEDCGDHFEHISVPVRRVIARALAKAKLRELGKCPTAVELALLARARRERRQ